LALFSYIGVRDTRTKDIIHETRENSNHFFVKFVNFNGFVKKQGILYKKASVFLVKTTVIKILFSYIPMLIRLQRYIPAGA